MMKRLIGLTVVALLMMACGGPTVAPTPPPPPRVVPACERNNTATLIMRNDSPNLLPRTAHLDGLNIGVIPYGNELSREVAAGVAHTLYFTDTRTGVRVTATANPIIAQCGTSRILTTYGAAF